MVITEVVVNFPQPAMNRVGAGDGGVNACRRPRVYGEKPQEAVCGLTAHRFTWRGTSRPSKAGQLCAKGSKCTSDKCVVAGISKAVLTVAGESVLAVWGRRHGQIGSHRKIMQHRISDRVELPFIVSKEKQFVFLNGATKRAAELL